MADWRNKLEMITNKVKSQLFAKGVDNLEQMKGVFLVSSISSGGFERSRHFSSLLNSNAFSFIAAVRQVTLTRMALSTYSSLSTSSLNSVSSWPGRNSALCTITSTITRTDRSPTLSSLMSLG